MSNSRANQATINNTAAQAAVNVGQRLSPHHTPRLESSAYQSRKQHITIKCIGKILVKSETDLKESKGRNRSHSQTTHQLSQENITLQKDTSKQQPPH